MPADIDCSGTADVSCRSGWQVGRRAQLCQLSAYKHWRYHHTAAATDAVNPFSLMHT